jgi:hypothetical protein
MSNFRSVEVKGHNTNVYKREQKKRLCCKDDTHRYAPESFDLIRGPIGAKKIPWPQPTPLEPIPKTVTCRCGRTAHLKNTSSRIFIEHDCPVHFRGGHAVEVTTALYVCECDLEAEANDDFVILGNESGRDILRRPYLPCPCRSSIEARELLELEGFFCGPSI